MKVNCHTNDDATTTQRTLSIHQQSPLPYYSLHARFGTSFNSFIKMKISTWRLLHCMLLVDACRALSSSFGGVVVGVGTTRHHRHHPRARSNDDDDIDNNAERRRINLLDRPNIDDYDDDGGAAEPLYCLNVVLRIKPERRTEFLECIKMNQLGTLNNEPRAVSYVYGEDDDLPNTFRFFEQYVGVAGFDEHRDTSHFANWEKFANTDPFTSDPEVRFYEEDDDAAGGGGCGKAAVVVGAGVGTVRDVLLAGNDDDGDGDDVVSVGLTCLDGRIHVRPECRDSFLSAIREYRDGILSYDPDAVSFVFGEDVDEPNVFHVFEAYYHHRRPLGNVVGREGEEKRVEEDDDAARAPSVHRSRWEKFVEEERPFLSPIEVGRYAARLPY